MLPSDPAALMEHSNHTSHSHHTHHKHEASPAHHEHGADDQNSFNKHAGHHTQDFLKRFWICLVITVPILLLSEMIQHWAGFYIQFPGEQYILLVLSSFIYFYGGSPFLKGMIAEIRGNAIGMMTLVAVAITVAFVYSVAVVFGLKGMDFFWELATLIDIMLLGHWLEMRSEMAASRSLQSLVELLPSTVHLESDNDTVTDISLDQLKNGDVLVIKPGEKIPADSVVIDGNSYVNESMLTGESKPVRKSKDDKVIAGSINGDGMLRVRATGTGKDSYLQKVITLVQQAQSAKSNTQNLADKVAKWLTIISILTGILTLAAWMLLKGDLAFALERMVTVMVTSCPHALGVAIPLVAAISTSKAAVNGLLIRNRTAFENSRKLTTIIFDKTGTLTHGSHEVQKVISLNDSYTDNEILQYAAAVQRHSEHYIGRGMQRELQNRKLDLWQSENFTYHQGMGVSGTVKNKQVIAAGPNYFRGNKKEIPVLQIPLDIERETISYILIDDQLAGIITLADTIRETSAHAIKRLKAAGIKTYLLTGDNEKIAASVADKLSMDGYFANVLPHEKREKLMFFQDKGEVVAMTGDGVNDAPALAQADVGIAVGSGTDVAAETADIILVNSDPEDVADLISYGRATYRKMVQNLFWAIGYNVVAIPLAAGILYPEFVLSPALGAVLMSLSTIIVAFNAQLLKLEKKS